MKKGEVWTFEFGEAGIVKILITGFNGPYVVGLQPVCDPPSVGLTFVDGRETQIGPDYLWAHRNDDCPDAGAILRDLRQQQRGGSWAIEDGGKPF